MKTHLILVAALLLTVLAIVPAQAMQLPPPCQTMTSTCCGIEPAFAPCCTLLSCPPEPNCPEQDIEPVTSAIQLPVGTVVAVETDSDCSATTCVDQEGGNVCDEQACAESDATCCTVDGRATGCTCEATGVSTSDFFAYLGPHFGLEVDDGCDASVQHDDLPIECTCDPILVWS
jgi:hypothetical protein